MHKVIPVDAVRASRAGHNFHEYWAARRALQLIFPRDGLYAIAVEGISTSDSATPGKQAEDIADLTLYFGHGDSFASSDRVETAQFKYKVSAGPETASYLKKTLGKFANSILGYEKTLSPDEVNKKLSFAFVTNARFSEPLWQAIRGLKDGVPPSGKAARAQFDNLSKWVKQEGIDPYRLFAMTEFRAAEKSLSVQKSQLRGTLTDWSAGADSQARVRLHALVELVVEKAGLGGQRNNLLKREDVLDALGCDPDELFPADARFIDVGSVVQRSVVGDVVALIQTSPLPVFIHADGGIGKTVFIQSVASHMATTNEVIVFDCFGGGTYRSDHQPRHLPRIGLVQIVNELAARGLCDPLLPGDNDTRGLIKSTRKRFEQTAATLREQSEKQGLLVIIDAADNAQLEADKRKEDSFPKLLLSSLSEAPIEAVRLVLTARPYRMDNVVGQTAVTQYGLGPFSDAEARSFVKARLHNVAPSEVDRALARSRCNARVLAYLVETWDRNVAGNTSEAEITVQTLIAQQCQNLIAGLDAAGWTKLEINEFFAALALLPPPIPLADLANALGWSPAHVNSAASDLAPMLEVIPQGAIFRDEPTETYVHDAYSGDRVAQQAIAQRLQDHQSMSAYAAEALPGFLVAIDDSDRAFDLANSTQFPSSIQSDYGKRRLTLARRHAAFRLAVNDRDLDRAVRLSMLLAEVASANSRGDQFIRRSPGLGVQLGDPDVLRRLFNDRSGWRGARDVRLTLAYAFAGDRDEARHHCSRAIGWINWSLQTRSDDTQPAESVPDASDYAAAVFLSILEGKLGIADKNLVGWSTRFAISVCEQVIALARQHELLVGSSLLGPLSSFAGSKSCRSFALKVCLLAHPGDITVEQAAAISRNLSSVPAPSGDEERGYGRENELHTTVLRAATTMLLLGLRSGAARLLKSIKPERPSSYDYRERHSYATAFVPALLVCLRAWSSGREVTIADLIPSEVKLNNAARALRTDKETREFIAALQVKSPRQPDTKLQTKPSKRKKRRQFDDREVSEIVGAIGAIRSLIAPIEQAMLGGKQISAADIDHFLASWVSKLRPSGHWETDDAIVRRVGVGIASLITDHAVELSVAQSEKLIAILSGKGFLIGQRIAILAGLAQRGSLNDVVGKFARVIAEDIRKEEFIERRGENYVDLTAALLPLSTDEAREYYRQGLAELDQIGGDDSSLVYGLLRYAAHQRGGLLRPNLGHRLMNLCQIIINHEPSKFGWTLFGHAMARSVGTAALYKLIRWAEQDLADFSYGLPQLVSFLTRAEALDPRRAAVLLLVCEDHAWYDWKIGTGLADILDKAQPTDRPRIFSAVFEKLKAEYPQAGVSSVWESVRLAAEKFPGAAPRAALASLRILRDEAKRRTEDYNSRKQALPFAVPSQASETEEQQKYRALAEGCDPASATEIDQAVRRAEDDSSRPYFARRCLHDVLAERCPYEKRLGFLNALCEVSTIAIDEIIERMAQCVTEWKNTTAHIPGHSKEIVERLFSFNGSRLFELRHGSISRHVETLIDISGDRRFVLQQMLRTVANEQLELDGEEWLEIATMVCSEASNGASLDALELMLSGPSARIADEIGEGPFKPQFSPPSDQTALLSDVLWCLLGDPDAYVRWPAAKAIDAMVDLDLDDDLAALVDRFDEISIPALHSSGHRLAFQNSQQWLLIGLARAGLRHGRRMAHLTSGLAALAGREDVHVINKLHLFRCLGHIHASAANVDLDKAHVLRDVPECGFITGDPYPAGGIPQSGFVFGYEFIQSDIAALARLFGIAQSEAIDSVAAEIVRRWPEAKDMDYFGGHDRYRHDRNDRHEFYRDHIQKHALISAGTRLSKVKPVVRSSHEDTDWNPWSEWLARYDITFEDGSLLADHKDALPSAAKASVLGPQVDNRDVLEDRDLLLSRIGLHLVCTTDRVPLYGHWSSPDGVSIRLAAGLTGQRGAITKCAAFAKRPDHDMWLPMFDGYTGGRDRFNAPNPFEPIIWDPDADHIGIDQGDRLATRGAATRPRLGADLTSRFQLAPHENFREWRTPAGDKAVWSSVWGEWQPSGDYGDHRIQNNGELLWADPKWLDAVLLAIDRLLAYKLTFVRYKSSRDYDARHAVKAVYVILRRRDGTLRVWHAKDASRQPSD